MAIPLISRESDGGGGWTWEQGEGGPVSTQAQGEGGQVTLI